VRAVGTQGFDHWCCTGGGRAGSMVNWVRTRCPGEVQRWARRLSRLDHRGQNRSGVDLEGSIGRPELIRSGTRLRSHRCPILRAPAGR
jgi:hypothetical protein